jgi:CRP-like cAMP-binding protein
VGVVTHDTVPTGVAAATDLTWTLVTISRKLTRRAMVRTSTTCVFCALRARGGAMPGYDRSAYVVYLSRVPMFSKCSDQQLERLASNTAERAASDGEAIVREGDAGDEFFVIADGAADVTRGGRAVATLGPGDFFGELALLDPAPRDATVTASAPSNLLVLSRATFTNALDDLPALRDAVLHGMARRIHEFDARF